MREPAAEAPDHGLGKAEEALEDAARIHQVGDEDEQRNRQQQIVVVEPVHGLVDHEAEILMGRRQVGEPGRQHRQAHGRAHAGGQKERRGQDPKTEGHMARP